MRKRPAGGGNCDFNDDENILAVVSPKTYVKGPYSVVHKDAEKRWAIVTMRWDDNPCLGIRWFWNELGNPQSSGYPTWVVIPDSLCRAILKSLLLDSKTAHDIEQFLAGNLCGEKLRDNN